MDNQKIESFTTKEILIILLLTSLIVIVLGLLVYLLMSSPTPEQMPKLGLMPTPAITRISQAETQKLSLPTVTSTPDQADPASGPDSIPTATPVFNPDDWVDLPVVPETNNNIRDIYLKGQALGNDPKSFSKIGDCNSLDPYFLSYLDLGSSAYNLGNFAYLKPVIDQFAGSFKRVSEAVGNGYNTSAVLSPFRANPDDCHAGETPLECEYRVHKPSFALISIGTDDYIAPAKYETNMRQILDLTIKQGIVPILVTKMDNANQLNYNPIIAKLAVEYNIPLINLWSALQPLPDHGLLDDIHPSGYTDGFIFSEANLSRYGWPVRNLAFLRGLYAAWEQVNKG